MTLVNGLRLAYRGFVTGLAAGYAWLATAMLAGAILQADALAALRPVVALLAPGRNDSATAFVIGFAAVQLAAAGVGMIFAYFFARFFTVRSTVALAAPCFALLAWALIAAVIGDRTDVRAGLALVPVLATLAYGALLGAGLPLRGDVLRPPTKGATPA
jgi:hypothetical protein